MITTRTTRTLGLLGVLGGACLLAVAVLQMIGSLGPTTDEVLSTVGFLGLAAALIGLLRMGAAPSRPGRAGLWIWIVVVCVIYAAGAAFVYANSRRNIPRALRPLSLTYMLMLCVLSVSLILPLLTAFWWGKLVAFFGATFFLASDGVLCDMLFVKKAEPTQQNFVVMCTYILAQTLLAIGFAACP